MRSEFTLCRFLAAPARERQISRHADDVWPSWALLTVVGATTLRSTLKKMLFKETLDIFTILNTLLAQLVINPRPSIQVSILPRVAAGEPRAMNDCITHYGNLVWGIVRRSLKDNAAAEDLVQEIFTEIWKKAALYDSEMASETTFIALVARRRAIDFLRRQGRQPDFQPLEAAGSIPDSTAPEPSLNCDPEAVKSAIASLPDDTRQLFRLFFEEGFTHPEIAEKTALPLGTVKTRLRRGLITLREQLRHVRISNPQPAS